MRTTLSPITSTAVLVFLFCGPMGCLSAAEADDKHSPAELSERLSALRKAFVGTIDIYFDSKQLETSTPGISGARFLDIVDISGKDLLRFEKGNERWLIDPYVVLAFKIMKEQKP